MAKNDFLAGVVVGFLIAGILGYILQRIRLSQARMGASGRKQTVRMETDRAPIEVVRDSATGAVSCFVWIIILLAFGGLLFFLGRWFLAS